MEILKNDIEKLCSFYVSDWHLVTMLLPYINKQINEKSNIITILENDIEENIKTLIKKLNLKNENNILNLDWKECGGIKYSTFKEKMSKLEENAVTNVIFISGKKSYIDLTNKNVKKFIQENKEKARKMKIKIIDCYEVGEFNMNIQEILNEHSKILNTSGEKEISEVFEGYA